MAKRGRPKKVDADIEKVVGSEELVVDKKLKEYEAALPVNHDPSISFDMSDREAIYEKAEAVNRGEEKPESDVTTDMVAKAMEAEGIPVQDVQPDSEQQEVPPVEEEQQEAEPEKEATEYKSEEDKDLDEIIKKVPLSALHEEREKRKERDRLLAEKDAQIEQLIKDNREFMSRLKQDDYGYEEEKPAYVKQLEDRLARFEEREELREHENRQNTLNSVINDIDSKLSEKGYPGFSTFGKSAVTDILRSMRPEDAQTFDTPDGWSQLYVEKVYPNVKSLFEKQFRGEHFAKKDSAKSRANLVRSTGKVIDSKPEEVKLTPYEEYMKERNAAKL